MKKITLLLLVFIYLFPSVVFGKTQELNTVSSVLIEAQTGQILSESDKELKFYPGNLSDIVLLNLFSSKINPEDIITVSEDAFNSSNSSNETLGALKGEKFSAEALMNGINLISADDAKYALSEKISENKDEFKEIIKKENEKIGCNKSDFSYILSRTPQKSYSTVYDISLILKNAVKNNKFLSVYTGESYSIPTTDVTYTERNLRRSVGVFSQEEKEELGILGYTYDFNIYSKNSLAFYGDNGKRKIIGVITGCSSLNQLREESVKLIKYGFGSFNLVKLRKDEIPAFEEDLMLYQADGDVGFLLKSDEKKENFKYEYSKDGIKIFNEKGNLLGIAPVKVTKQIPVYIIIIRVLLFSLVAIVLLIIVFAAAGIRKHNKKKKERRERLKRIMQENETTTEKEKV